MKPNKSGMAGKVSMQTQPGGRFTAENVTARQLIRYRLSAAGCRSCLAGPNGWTTTASTSWRRRSGDDLGDAVSAERSGAAEPRAADVAGAARRSRSSSWSITERARRPPYALVAARRDGALGPQPASGRRSTARRPMFRPARLRRLRLMPGNMIGGGASMAQLANSLAAFVGRIVFDRTGAHRRLRFHAQVDARSDSGGLRQESRRDRAAADRSERSVDFHRAAGTTRAQTGRAEGPVDALVIDRAEHPVEN